MEQGTVLIAPILPNHIQGISPCFNTVVPSNLYNDANLKPRTMFHLFVFGSSCVRSALCDTIKMNRECHSPLYIIFKCTLYARGAGM